MAESRLVTGLFRDRDSAERAYQSVTERGYGKDDVSLVMSDETRKRHFAGDRETELGSKAAKGAGIGGAIGGTLGAIAAAVAAVGTSIAIPGLGLVVAGPIAAALAGAGAGAATGGLVGALIGWGMLRSGLQAFWPDRGFARIAAMSAVVSALVVGVEASLTLVTLLGFLSLVLAHRRSPAPPKEQP